MIFSHLPNAGSTGVDWVDYEDPDFNYLTLYPTLLFVGCRVIEDEDDYPGEPILQEFRSLYRFDNVTIPNGATITGAYVNVTSSAYGQPQSRDTEIYICFELAATPSLISTVANFETLLNNLTVSKPLWDIGTTQWTDGSAYSTPSIVVALQEVVNLPGWASGNQLNFVMLPGVDKSTIEKVDGQDYYRIIEGRSAVKQPELVVTWSGGSGTYTTPTPISYDYYKQYNKFYF